MRQNWAVQVERSIGKTIRASPNGAALVLGCACGYEQEIAFAAPIAIEGVRKRVEAAGWRRGRKLTCPKCVAKEKEDKPVHEKPEPTPSAKRMHRAVMEALMIGYDDEAKRYAPNTSDQTISTETGAAVEYVRRMREEYFGPISEPPEIIELRAALDGLVGSIASTRRDMAAARQIVDAGEAAISDLDRKASEIRDRLTRLASSNKWTIQP